jgi:hypothetical protein
VITFSTQARKNGPLAPHSPLPRCRRRNEDPVGKHAKVAKVAKAKADKEAKAAHKKKEAAKANAARETLAEMEADESFLQVHEFQHRTRQLSNMEARADENSDSGNESTDLIDGGGECSESETNHDLESAVNDLEPPKKYDKVSSSFISESCKY